MRRRLNIKLLTGLVCGTLLFGVGVYFLHDFQVKRNAQGLVRRADLARTAGDLDETVRLLRRYLAHRPDDTAQFKQIALDAKKNLFAKIANRQVPAKRDIDLVVYLVEEAVRKNVTDVELRREAADFWFNFRRYDDAVENLEVIKTEWTAEDQLRYIDCLRLKGGPSEELAIEQLEKVLGFDREKEEFVVENAEHPELLAAYRSLALLLLQRRVVSDLAEQTLDQMVEVNKDNYEAYLIRSRNIRYIQSDGWRDRYRSDVQKAFELAPDRVDTMLAMASMHIEKQEYDEAKKLVEDGLTKTTSMNEKSRLFNLLAQIHISQKDTDGALAVIDRGNAQVPHDRDLLWTKARLLLDRKQYADVEQMYGPLEKANLSPPMIEYLKARIQMDKGDYINGTKNLAAIRELVPKLLQYDIDVYLSIGYTQTQQHDLRLKTVERMLAVNPDNDAAQENYVQVLMLLGRDREAFQYLESLIPKLVAKGKPVSSNLRLLRTQLRVKLTIGNRVADVSASDLKDIQQEITQLYRDEEIPETSRRALLIEYFRKMNDPARAKKAVMEALESDPSAFGLWALRIDYADTIEEANQAFQQMQSHVDDPALEVTMRSMPVKIALKLAPETAAEAFQKAEQGVAALPADQQASLLFELGRLQMLQKNRTEGIRLLELASQKAPARIEILSALYQDANDQSDPNRINTIVNRIRSVTGTNDDTWRMAEAGRIIWMIRNGHVAEAERHDKLTQVRQLLQRVRTNRPEHVPVILMEAELQRIAGEISAAIESLQRAHGLQPGNANIIRMVAQYYKDLGDSASVDRWMNKLPLAMRSSNDKRVELTSLWQRRQGWSQAETEKAIELVSDLVPETSQEANDWILRSQILLQAKQPQQAIEAAMRAKQLGAGIPDAWTNLVDILVAVNNASGGSPASNRQDPRIQEVLQEAEIELPEQIKPGVLGKCYAVLGDYAQAQAHFAVALRNDPQNTTLQRLFAETLLAQKKTVEAAKQIDQILSQANPAESDANVVWARRAMARILSATESYTAFNKGLELIEQNAVDDRLSHQDLALWLSLCYARPERRSWDKALIRLKEVEDTRPLNNDELFMKAQLYERYDNEAYWQQANEITVNLLSRNPSNQQVVQSYIKWLLKRGKLREAKRYATNNLDQSAVMRLRVELHVDASEGRIQDAVKKLRQRVPQDTSTREGLSSLLTLSALAEDLGQYHDGFYQLSQTFLTELVKQSPRQILRLATSMGLHGDVSKIKTALKHCMAADKQGVPVSMCAGVALSILREHPSKWESDLASEVAEVGRWLDQLGAAHPDDLALRWRVAEFHDMAGNLDRVESEYSHILGSPEFQNPLDRGMLLNNLAYAMALNGKGDRPLELIGEAEQLLGPTSDVIDTRGYIYFVRGDLDAAIDEFNNAITNGPETAQKHFHLAMALDKRGDGDKAAQSWEQALNHGLTKFTLPRALRDEFEALQVKYGGQTVAAI